MGRKSRLFGAMVPGGLTVAFLSGPFGWHAGAAAQPAAAPQLSELPPGLALSPASTQVIGPLELTVLRTVNLPLQHPEVILRSQRPLREVTVEVTLGGEVVSRQFWAELLADRHQSVTWHAPEGQHRATVAIVAQLDGQPFAAETTSTLEVFGPLHVTLTAADVNTEVRRLKFRSNRPARSAVASFYDLDGRMLHRQEAQFSRVKAAYEIQWPVTDRSVARIALRVFASDDSWADVSWHPIQVELPPPPLLFEDGSSAVASADVPKLNQLAADVRALAKGHRGVRGLALYVLGVGADASAKGVADQRAREVARHVKRKGISMPVKATGVVDAGRAAGIEFIVGVHPPIAAEWRSVR